MPEDFWPVVTPVTMGDGSVGEGGASRKHRISSSIAAVWPAQILMNTQQRSSQWIRMKKRLLRRGLVDVDVDHHKFKMLQRFRAGVRDIMTSFPRIEPQVELVPEDYKQVRVRSIKGPDGKTFEFTSYAPDVFSSLRQAIGVSEQAYLASLAPDRDVAFLEFVSNSKGGQDLYITHDKRHFLKTERYYYVKIFLNMLEEYLDHFLAYPHSLLVKFLGLHAMQVQGKKKVFFMVMQSVFYPDERIQARYDLKGCLAGRYQKTDGSDTDASVVLKDRNFLDEDISLGNQRTWFIRQLELDVAFLRRQRVIDYSLLVGRHGLHPLDKRQDIGEIITRVTKSMAPSDGRRRSSEPVVNGYNINPTPGSPTLLQNPSHLTVRVRSQRRVEPLPDPPRRSLTPSGSSAQSSVVRKLLSLVEPYQPGDSAVLENRRLLPNSKNALHIIDGEDTRYYIGIIDFLTKYRFRQRAGKVIKDMRFCCGDHSTRGPQVYADRFLHFIYDHTS